jgi:ABC-type transporter Mla subunit MlaD
MHDPSDSTLLEFQQIASDIRRERTDLEARLERLSKLCAETKTLIARSRQSIDHSVAVLDGSPSLVPEPVPDR